MTSKPRKFFSALKINGKKVNLKKSRNIKLSTLKKMRLLVNMKNYLKKKRKKEHLFKLSSMALLFQQKIAKISLFLLPKLLMWLEHLTCFKIFAFLILSVIILWKNFNLLLGPNIKLMNIGTTLTFTVLEIREIFSLLDQTNKTTQNLLVDKLIKILLT